MKFDKLLHSYLGEFGRYQKIQLLLVCVPAIFTGMHALSWTFTAADIRHRCQIPGENESTPFNLAESHYTNISFEQDTLKCSRRKSLTLSQYTANTSTLTELENCYPDYKWDHSEVENTAISKWNIVCDRAWIKAFVQSMYYVGMFFGSIVFGIFGDKIGRKKVFLMAILLQMTCGTVMAFVPHWAAFALFRIGVGFCHPGIYVIANVIGLELLGPSKRRLAATSTGAFFGVGQVILGAIAMAFRNYQYIQIAISLPNLICLLYWWLVPESARWLVSRGRIQEADAVLKKAAKCNKVHLPENWHENLEEPRVENESGSKTILWDLFRFPTIRRRILICYFCWPVVSAVYYGLSMNPTFFGGHRFYTFMAAGFMEIPGLVFVFLTIDRWGRKVLCTGGYLTTSFCLLSTLLVPDNMEWLKAVQVVFSKTAITATYAILYTFTPEMFPTTIRNTALGSCSMMARVGDIGASYVAMWLVYHSKTAMVLLFGVLSLSAGIFALLLPETAGKTLPESIHDVENFKGESEIFVVCNQENSSSSIPPADQELQELMNKN